MNTVEVFNHGVARLIPSLSTILLNDDTMAVEGEMKVGKVYLQNPTCLNVQMGHLHQEVT